MKRVYRVLAYAVAAGVVAQAMVIVYAVGSLQKWVERGGVYDSTVVDDHSAFSGAGAFGLHEIIGSAVVPGLVVLALIAALAARLRRGAQLAGIMFVLVAAQAMLGYEVADQPAIGSLHGLFAFALFATAMRAGQLAAATSPEQVAPPVATRA